MSYKEIKARITPNSIELEKPTLSELKSTGATPGARILAYRKAAGLTQRALAEMCDPPMDFTAIGRIEKNRGYTSSTLNKLATALQCEVCDFFLPYELMVWRHLDSSDRQEISNTIFRYWQSSANNNSNPQKH